MWIENCTGCDGRGEEDFLWMGVDADKPRQGRAETEMKFAGMGTGVISVPV